MLFDFIELDLNNNGNLYNDLYNEIKHAVLCGAVNVGDKLPSIREAASQLGISRTTVENAYTKLCIEGIAESLPQKGYFIINAKTPEKSISSNKEPQLKSIKYDFSSRRIDKASADIENWKKTVRSVLLETEELTSYGDSQGEIVLREALSSYSYKARGVKTIADNIVIGAGIGPLLNILCGLVGRKVKVGFENDGFKKAETVFGDYGIKTHILESDSNGAKIERLLNSDTDILFLTPSALSKFSITSLSKRRNDFCDWANKEEHRFIIEDDYNGELRYTARTVPAFQGKEPDKTVYIGSFSKLLLPSVRIAYMVLPPFLADKFKQRKSDFNQTCGKIEQIALAKYITSGSLEKHLRRLRRLYYNKSKILCDAIKENFNPKELKLFESSLTVEVIFENDFKNEEICQKAYKKGIVIMPSQKKNTIKLCFAGIKTESIQNAIKELKEILC